MSYQLTVTFDKKVNKRNVKQLRNITKTWVKNGKFSIRKKNAHNYVVTVDGERKLADRLKERFSLKVRGYKGASITSV